MPQTFKRTALLIDADNVSTDVVAQVLERLGAGAHVLQHRRAYGSVQKAGEFAEFCRDHAIRFLPSTFAGPNATDIALAIDAVELVLRQPLDEIVLVSSDMDYSPLIVRLRELGCRVTGYGQHGKSGSDIARDYERVYDAFEVIGQSKPAAKKAAAPRKAAKPAVQPTAAVTPPHAPLQEEVRRILEVVPELLGGTKVELSTAAKALRAAQLLAKNAPSTKLFKKYPEQFELSPARQPNKVLYSR